MTSPRPAAQPVRVVSLVPCLTETVAALGGRAELVGVTRYCVHPASLPPAVARVGGVRDPDIEAVCRLAPDLILMDFEENRRADWLALNARSNADVLVARISGLADVVALVHELGRRFDAADAARHLIARIARIAQCRPSAAPAPPRQRAVVLLWPDPIVVAGPATYLADALRCCGLEVVRLGDERYPRPSLADLVRARPAVLVLPDEPYAFSAAEEAEWTRRLALDSPDGTDAVTLRVNGQALCWYGARTPDGIETLRRTLRAAVPGLP